MSTILQDHATVTLPEGFTARGASMPDVEAAIVLYNRWSQSAIGEDEITDADAIRNEWKSPNFDPARDIRVVFAPNGRMVGYVEVWTTVKPVVHPWIWGHVDPDYGRTRDRHLDADLGRGTRAPGNDRRLPADLRFAPRVGNYRQVKSAKQLFESLGYHYIRSSYQMRIELDAPGCACLA